MRGKTYYEEFDFLLNMNNIKFSSIFVYLFMIFISFQEKLGNLSAFVLMQNEGLSVVVFAQPRVGVFYLLFLRVFRANKPLC